MKYLYFLIFFFLTSCAVFTGPYKNAKVRDEFKKQENKFSIKHINVKLNSSSASKKFKLASKENALQIFKKKIYDSLFYNIDSTSLYEMKININLIRRLYLLNMRKVKKYDYEFRIRLEKDSEYLGNIVKSETVLNGYKFRNNLENKEQSLVLLTTSGDTVRIRNKDIIKSQKMSDYIQEEQAILNFISDELIKALKRFK